MNLLYEYPTLAPIVIFVGPVFLLVLCIAISVKFYELLSFRKIAKELDYSIVLKSYFPLKFILRNDKYDVHCYRTGGSVSITHFEVSLKIKSSLNVLIHVAGLYEKAVEHLDKKLKNTTSYDYLFNRKYFIQWSNLPTHEVRNIFDPFLRRVLTNCDFHFIELHLQNDKLKMFGQSKTLFKYNKFYIKVIEHLFDEIENRFYKKI